MKCLLLYCLLLSPFCMQAQHIPDSVTYSPEKFAGYLQARFTGRSSQLNALYSWITANIRYDKDSAMYFNWNADHATKISATLRRRKGVCENFASLFADIAGRLSIPAYVVHGYPAWSENNKDNSHSWVAVQHNGEWYLSDPTWDAQPGGREKYFMITPEDFIRTHIPFDPLWQLLEKPVHYPLAATKFMYKDSVQAFLQMDSLQQFLAAERRINNSTAQNSMTKNWQSHNRMNVAIIAGQNDETLYNEAVGLLNRAGSYLNNFIQYRNAVFMPQKPAEEIKQMLSPIAALLTSAKNKIAGIGKQAENFQYNTASLLQKIMSVEKRTAEQLDFLHRYTITSPPERARLFLN